MSHQRDTLYALPANSLTEFHELPLASLVLDCVNQGPRGPSLIVSETRLAGSLRYASESAVIITHFQVPEPFNTGDATCIYRMYVQDEKSKDGLKQFWMCHHVGSCKARLHTLISTGEVAAVLGVLSDVASPAAIGVAGRKQALKRRALEV